MTKRRHMTAEEINDKYRIQAIVAEEMRRQMNDMVLEDEVIAAIRATHLEDMAIMCTVLLDRYKDTTREWLQEFIEYNVELLKQHNDRDVELKQMVGHVKIKTGIDVEKYTDQVMEFEKIDNKEQT